MHLYKLLLPVAAGLMYLGCAHQPAATNTPASTPASTATPPPRLVINFEKPVNWVCLRDKFNAYKQQNTWVESYQTAFYSRHDDVDNVYSVATFPYPRRHDLESTMRQFAAQCPALTPQASD